MDVKCISEWNNVDPAFKTFGEYDTWRSGDGVFKVAVSKVFCEIRECEGQPLLIHDCLL